MTIYRISQSIGSPSAIKTKGSAAGANFLDLLQNALSRVNSLQVKADQLSEEFALGLNDNVQEVMLAVQEAQLALQLTVQIRNKLTEAFQELMRMQI